MIVAARIGFVAVFCCWAVVAIRILWTIYQRANSRTNRASDIPRKLVSMTEDWMNDPEEEPLRNVFYGLTLLFLAMAACLATANP